MYQAVEYAGAVRLVAADVPAALLGGTAADAQFLALPYAKHTPRYRIDFLFIKIIKKTYKY